MKRRKPAFRTLLLCVVLIIELVPAFSNGPVTISVVMSRDIAPYRDALRGFEQSLDAAGVKYRLDEINIDTLRRDPKALKKRVKSRRPQLILTLGSAATDLVSDEIKDIPIIFSLVLPSKGRNSLEEMRGEGSNVTGATMEVPVAVQFRKIKDVMPTISRIGVLYDPAVSGPMIESARKQAEKVGLELVAKAVTSEKDVVKRMKELGDEVDVLWSVADSTVFTPQGLKHILLSTLRNGLPFVGLSPAFVKAGALLALSCDYVDVGRQSGELANRVLSGEKIEDIPTVVPRDISLSLNLHTARQIQVAISPEVANAATQVY